MGYMGWDHRDHGTTSYFGGFPGLFTHSLSNPLYSNTQSGFIRTAFQ
jgi:hypothetical protein